MRIKNLLLAILLFGVTMGFAAPFQNIERILTQPDGTVLHCFASGDEFYIRLHDADGYTIVQATNGFFVYATTDNDGNVIPTEHIAGKSDPKTLGLRQGICISQKEYQKRRDEMKAQDIRNRNELSKGVFNNLVVFIKFKGDNDITTTATEIDSMLNHNGHHDISMNNYFKKNTYNQLSMMSYCYPQPQGDKIIAYEDIYPRNYYQPYNETTNPEGYTNQAEREFPLLKRAIEYIADQVPEDLNIDRNNDGVIDNVIFVVKGGVDGWSSLLWPHMWTLEEDAYINGKKVGNFNFQLETATQFTVSTLCHEMSHSLGFPDLYHYDEDLKYLSPVGRWDLMCSNAEPPQHTGTYTKHIYGSWIDEIPEITEYGTYTIEATSWEGGRRNCFKIKSQHDPNQYYLVEYRNNKAIFETGLPSGGLLIYRIDSRYSGSIYYDGQDVFDEVYIFRPGGTFNEGGNLDYAAFSEESGKTEFNHTTDPYPFLNKHIIDDEFNICNISAMGDKMTFTYCPANIGIIPKNLIVNIKGVGQDVELKWQNVAEAESYNIYRDGVLLASNVTTNSYIDDYDNITDGYHTYYVTSNCGNEESYRSNEECVIIGEYCEYVIDMTTSGESGWQGGEIKTSFNNGTKDSYHTLYSGTNGNKNIIVPTGINMSFHWISGWDDSKCSFTIKNKGENIYTSAELEDGVFKTITTEGTTAVTPKDLSATTVNADVHLNWTTYVETESFSIMRNGEVIADGIKGCHYIDNSAPHSGTYHYNVIANNAGHSSEPSETVVVSVMKYNHTDFTLNNEGTENNVSLSWNAPVLKEGAFRYDDGEYVTNIGANSYNWGIRIPAKDLSTFAGTQISSVEIYDNYDGKYTFKIYNGDEIDNDNLIHTEAFNTTKTNTFVRFELSEKIDFDTTKDIWITAKASNGKEEPIPCGEFYNDPNSNLIKVGNKWESATRYDMPYSWLLRVYTTTPESYSLTYNLYRNHEVIASDLTTMTYAETLNTTDKTCYNVQAVHNGIVVARSNDLCLNDTDGFEENHYKKVDIYPNPVKDILYINTPNIRNITIATITGSIVFDQDVKDNNFSIDVNDFNKGIYIIKIATSTEVMTEKIVVY